MNLKDLNGKCVLCSDTLYTNLYLNGSVYYLDSVSSNFFLFIASWHKNHNVKLYFDGNIESPYDVNKVSLSAHCFSCCKYTRNFIENENVNGRNFNVLPLPEGDEKISFLNYRIVNFGEKTIVQKLINTIDISIFRDIIYLQRVPLSYWVFSDENLFKEKINKLLLLK